MLGIASALALGATGLLLMVHMGGHYLAARLCRMHLRVGMGPTLLTRTSRAGARFQLRLFPFGAYTQISAKGGEPDDPRDYHAYPNRPAWQRLLMVIAGPAANYLFAGVLATGLYVCHGIERPRWYGVAHVYPDYDAYGKLAPGDRILAVDHVPLYVDEGPSLTDRVAAARGAPLTLTFERNGESRDVQLTPRQDTDSRGQPTWRIGVAYERQYRADSVGLLDGLRRGMIDYPADQIQQIGKALYGVVFGSGRADPGGPIRMMEEFDRAFSTGVVQSINLLMMLSIYWALFTLLPLPGLDGGRLVFQLFEIVTRRHLNPRIEAWVHSAGILAYIGLNLIVLFINIIRFAS